ncbi:MAG: patatin-like phospholipase family protein [Acidobacteriota bacterium]|nr:patatin-like phospholipase family protein [Acidobacteriota bacterium]
MSTEESVPPASSSPGRCCDLVMKGGVTSGILYPPAIARIARDFHLVGIGGTSAGAIAGCLAAAAEYRRRTTGSMVGFELLEKIPQELSGENLAALFRPDKETQHLFGFITQASQLKNAGWLRRLWWKARLVWKALWHKRVLRPVRDNGFGLCSGMAQGYRRREGDVPALTEWLADKLDEIAGKEDGSPLTFGDLHGAPVPEVLQSCVTEDFRSIDFRAVTTCVSFGRPYLLPFDTGLFAFDIEEWRGLFPRRIVDHLERRAGEVATETRRQDNKLPLPGARDLPVVVAARMSLSFPVLFSMVPLYATNYEKPEKDRSLEKVWFSDGGITSNLPIHCFDALYPRWPTLGINLQYTGAEGVPARAGARENLLYMIQRRSDGSRDLWHLFDGQGSSLKDLVGFLGAVFRSAQVWHDNGYLKLPAFKDRVVEIWLRPEEGGLNLKMPEKVVQRLVRRGTAAAEMLCQRFADPQRTDDLSWRMHRWARLRTGLEALAEALQHFDHNARHPLGDDESLLDLLAQGRTVPYVGFSSDAAVTRAHSAVEELLDWIQRLDPTSDSETHTPSHPFEGGPRPRVEMAVRPRM